MTASIPDSADLAAPALFATGSVTDFASVAASVAVRSFEFVRSALLAKHEIALLDVREEAAHALSHPLFAANLPLSRIETDAWTLLPRRDVPIVLLDDDGRKGGLAWQALHFFAALGYIDVAVLEGGSAGWGAAGGELFSDVNVPSKAFGELVEHVRGTPSLPAAEVRALLDTQANVFVADARRFDEYRTMSIPGATSVPGAELALRIRDLAPDPQTLVIVNCAGRTRSLIGTQSLVNAGIPNRVVALRNGTIGWTLAGLELERGQERRFGFVSESNRREAAESASHLARNAGVRVIPLETVQVWQRTLTRQNEVAAQAVDGLPQENSEIASARTTYFFDVRTPEEFLAGHIPGFRSVPGGQLVQETEMYAPVRGARIVLADSDGVRAPMTASWLAQMGWEVYTLEASTGDCSERGKPPVERSPLPDVDFITPHEFVDVLAQTSALAVAGDSHRGADANASTASVVVLDFATAAEHSRGHVPSARYILRSRLAEDLPQAIAGAGGIVLTSPDGYLAACVADRVRAIAKQLPVRVLAGGTQAWEAAGRPFEKGLLNPASVPTDRYCRPYEGTDNPSEAMAAYLEWEYGLVEQLRRDGTHGFNVI